MLDPEERQAVGALVRRFAARIDAVLFAGQEPDGDLARISELMVETQELGFAADPAATEPGDDLGVWGQACLDEGAERSLLVLSLLAEACGGLAAAVHAQGIGCLAAGGALKQSPGSRLAAAFMPPYGLPLGTPTVGSGLTMSIAGGETVLNGTSAFLTAAEPPQTLICFARQTAVAEAEAEWTIIRLEADAPGVKLAETGRRIGLRALAQYDLQCDRVCIEPDQVLQTGPAAHRRLERVLACDWLGQAAIALGIARRSLRDSRAYTAERYQGGRMIEEHASVQLLHGTAEYDIGSLAAILALHAAEPLAGLDTRTLLSWAIQTRLAVGEHAFRAVNSCLQAMGGYGYMADYRLEKRLRDTATLKSLHGAPDQLKLLLNELLRTN